MDNEVKQKALVQIAKGITLAAINKNLGIPIKTLKSWRQIYAEEITAIMISLNIRDLIRKEKFDKALELCDLPEAQNNSYIHSQRIGILIKQERFEEALSICENPRFENFAAIQSQRVSILMHFKRWPQALKICNKKRFKEEFYIQLQKMVILMRIKKWIEAIDFCDKSKFKDDRHFQQLRRRCVKYLKNKEEKGLLNGEEVEPKMDSYKQEETPLTNILRLIKERKISLDVINSYPLPDYQKVILTFAFYEGNNYPIPMQTKYLKEQKLGYSENAEMQKILKMLEKRFQAKSRIFDIAFYESLLSQQIEEAKQESPRDDERTCLMKLLFILNNIKEEREKLEGPIQRN